MKGTDLLGRALPRIAKLEASSGISFVDALNVAVEAVFLRLWEKKSDLTKKKMEVGTDADPFSMPTDFRGFAEDPYLVGASGNVVHLLPLPSGGARELNGVTGTTPQYYRLTGQKVQLFPGPVVDYDMVGEYFSCPKALTMESVIPWSDIFNEVIIDAIVEATKFGGLSGLLANQAFMITMEQSIDRILSSRSNPAPRRVRAHFF